MKLNTGNRAFLTLMVVAVGGLVAAGMAACCVLGIVAYRVATGGAGALSKNGIDPWATLVFVGVLATGSALGVASLRRQLIGSRRLAARVRAARVEVPDAVAATATRCRLGRRVDVVEAQEAFSFTHGLASPRVVVSTGLLDAVSAEELEAVLTHERYHVRNLDPLKVVLARTLSAAVFYLPVLADLRGRYVAGRELAADRRSLRVHGERPLAGALYKVVRGPAWVDLGAAAAIGGGEALEARVTQLETGAEPPLGQLSRSALGASALGAGVFAWSGWASLAPGAGVMAKLCSGR